MQHHLAELIDTLSIQESLPALDVPRLQCLLLIFLAGLAEVHLPSCKAALSVDNSAFQQYLAQGELQGPLFQSLFDRLA